MEQSLSDMQPYTNQMTFKQLQMHSDFVNNKIQKGEKDLNTYSDQ